MQKHIKIAVIGDPHFCSGAGPKNDSFSFNRLDRFENSPWNSLSKFIGEQGLEADILVCVGDMTSYADKTALDRCWSELCNLTKLLNAQLLVSTAGNHDVYSVLPNKIKDGVKSFRELENPRGIFEDLKSLNPPFPFVKFSEGREISQEDLRTQYFGENIAFAEQEEYAIFSYNSCAEHGHVPFEQERGTFPASTQNYLKKVFNQRSLIGKPHIFVLHYPPFPLSSNRTGVYDFVNQGDLLLDMLEETTENWLVIHGHKHFCNICYAHGGSCSPIVFSASSLGIPCSNDQGSSESSHQFYIIDIHQYEQKLRGKVSVWQWREGILWKTLNLEPLGFGERINTSLYAKKIAEFFCQQQVPSLAWFDITNSFPELNFILPIDQTRIMKELANKFSLVIEPPLSGILTKKSTFQYT